MCIQWTRVLYSVPITWESNPRISQCNSPCNEFTSVWSMFVYNTRVLSYVIVWCMCVCFTFITMILWNKGICLNVAKVLTSICVILYCLRAMTRHIVYVNGVTSFECVTVYTVLILIIAKCPVFRSKSVLQGENSSWTLFLYNKYFLWRD